MPLDAEDEKKIAALIAGALKTNNEELGKQFVTADAATKIVTQTLTKGLEDLKLDEKIANAVKGAGATGGDGGEKGGEGGGKKKGEGAAKDPELARLQEQLDNLTKANKAAEDARVAAEQRSREQAMEGAAKDALAKAGIPADRHAHALAYLRTRRTEDGKPVIDTAADGRIIWREQRKGYIDDLSLADGIKAWAGSDDGKVYVPPTGQQGTGTGAGTGSGGSGGGGLKSLNDIQIPLG